MNIRRRFFVWTSMGSQTSAAVAFLNATKVGTTSRISVRAR